MSHGRGCGEGELLGLREGDEKVAMGGDWGGGSSGEWRLWAFYNLVVVIFELDIPSPSSSRQLRGIHHNPPTRHLDFVRHHNKLPES